MLLLLFSVAGDEEIAGASAADSDTEPFHGIVFQIPGDHVGFIIGRDGKNISEIEGMTNTLIKITIYARSARLHKDWNGANSWE